MSRGAPVRLPDCPAFRAAWAGPEPHLAIGAELGVSGAAVSRAARRYRYPRRGDVQEVWGERRVRAWIAAAPAADPAPAPRGGDAGAAGPGAAPSLPHPRWGPAEDAAVIRTGGRYGELSEVAGRLGRPIPVVLQRWHRLRVAA